MFEPDSATIEALRTIARQDRSVAEMYDFVKRRLGESAHIVDICRCFQAAFGLSLLEAKPVFNFTLKGYVSDSKLLDEFVLPKIAAHRSEWDHDDQ